MTEVHPVQLSLGFAPEKILEPVDVHALAGWVNIKVLDAVEWHQFSYRRGPFTVARCGARGRRVARTRRSKFVACSECKALVIGC